MTRIAAGLKELMGRALERWPRLKAVAFVSENLTWFVKLRLGWTQIRYGTHRALPLDQSVSYIEGVYADYLRYGELEKFHGRVAELGPGDNAGVALLIRKSGAQQVDLIERFRNRLDDDQQRQIYEALSDQHGLEGFRIGPAWHRQKLAGITWSLGTSAESFMASSPTGTYDFIVSRAVLEHLTRPLSVLHEMSRALRPGGLLLHEVDLRDHLHFSPGHDELTWLSFPRWLWKAMTSHSGRPNRILVHRYRRTLEQLRGAEGIEFQLLVLGLVGGQEVNPPVPFDEIPMAMRAPAVEFVETRRRGFATEFREVDASDLAVNSFFIVARKLPASSSPSGLRIVSARGQASPESASGLGSLDSVGPWLPAHDCQ